MPAIMSSNGLRRISEPPCRAVRDIDATTETLSARADTKPVSGMAAARTAASTTSAVPPATIGHAEVDERKADGDADAAERSNTHRLRA